jgi:hypothetical protein
MNRTQCGQRYSGAGEAMEVRQNFRTPVISLVLAWGFVGIPLAWGAVQTLPNALKLFQ